MAEEEIKTSPETEETAPEAETAKTKKQKRSEKKNEAEALKAEIEKLTKELADSKDQYMRTLAEYDNYRKRSQREKDSAYGDSKANTLKLLLPVIDNFDRAADNKTDDIEVYRKGIEMTLNQFYEILKNMEVESFGEVGEQFDPNIHNAVMKSEDPSLPENSIAAVFEKGYRVGDRIIRCATVQVTE